MEAPDSNSPTIPNSGNSIALSTPVWPTIDGPLGLTEDESLSYARKFYYFGFALLPLLWGVNCLYFWPVLRHSRAFPRLRHCKFLSLRCQFSLPFCVFFFFRLFAFFIHLNFDLGFRGRV